MIRNDLQLPIVGQRHRIRRNRDDIIITHFVPWPDHVALARIVRVATPLNDRQYLVSADQQGGHPLREATRVIRFGSMYLRTWRGNSPQRIRVLVDIKES
jgi:hypothetical protein